MARVLDFTGGQCDIKVARGSEISFPFQMTAAGAPLDKTGRTFIAEIKKNITDTDPLLTFTITPGAAGTDPLIISASFDAVPTGLYHWDIWEQTASGDDRPLAIGRVQVVNRVVTAP